MRARVRHPLVLHTGAYWLMLTVHDAMAVAHFHVTSDLRRRIRPGRSGDAKLSDAPHDVDEPLAYLIHDLQKKPTLSCRT